MKTSVIVPAYNEEDRIETVLLNYANSFPDEEIIVVCDGTDNTKNIIREKSKKYPNIKFSTLLITDKIVEANVSIKGITKKLTFNIDEIVIENDKLILSLSSNINRQEFMLNGSMSAILADNVEVYAKITATKN